MGRPIPKSVSQPPHQFQRLANQLSAQRVEQPSADLPLVAQAENSKYEGSGKSSEEVVPLLHAAMRDHLVRAHQHADDLAGGNGGPVVVRGYRHSADHPTDALVEKTTLDDQLAEWYGKDWEQKREAMVGHKSSPQASPSYESARYVANQEENLTKPIYFVQHNARGASPFAHPWTGLVDLGGSGRIGESHGMALPYLRHHELSHLIAPRIGGDDLRKILLTGDRPSWAEGVQRQRTVGDPWTNETKAWHHMGYSAKDEELWANLAHMMRLEYGLTGQPIITPADRIRAAQSWMGSKAKIDPKAPGMHQLFGPDPMLQHGPEAGKPAHGYKFMREFFRNVLPHIEESKIIDMMGPLGSNERGKEQANAVV